MARGPTEKMIAAMLVVLFVVSAQTSTVMHHVAVEVKAEPPVDWLELARSAWNYFQPGVGLSRLGLNYASMSWHYLTDWDLGCYISAIIDAEALGLVDKEGTMGSDARIRKVLNFLATRPLHPSGVPYGVYDADTGEPGTTSPSNPSDAGRLLIALYRLKQHRPEFSNYIDYVVERNGLLKFAGGVPNNGFYSYYYAHGYYLWGARTRQVNDALNMLSTLRSNQVVDAYGVKLPFVEITMEPILHSIFELSLPGDFFYWANLTLQAQINRYKATGKLTAFTEGNLAVPPYYIYEWIVDIYTGKTFTLWSPSLGHTSLTPVVFTKAAIGMHAIWENEYTSLLLNYVMKAKTPNGFYEGVDENGNIIYIMTDKTNSLIINAARYALEKAKPPSLVVQATLETFPGESMTLPVLVNHSLSLPVHLNVSSGIEGLTLSLQNSSGKTPLKTNLTITVYNMIRPGSYQVIILATSPFAKPVNRTLTVIVKPPGYTLKMKALNACGEPAPNVTIVLGDFKGLTARDGTLTFRHLNGTYMLYAFLGRVQVADPTTITISSDTELTLKLKLYKVLIDAKTTKGTPAEGIILRAFVDDQFLSYAKTNSSGLAVLKNIPPGNITVKAYSSDGKIELGSWSITVRGDVDVVDPEIVVPEIGKIEA